MDTLIDHDVQKYKSVYSWWEVNVTQGYRQQASQVEVLTVNQYICIFYEKKSKFATA